MRVAITTLVVLLMPPVGARADAVTPPRPCEPGFSRDFGGPLGGLGAGMWGHGGAPRCEPAICRDASTCGPDQQCRTDTHCVQSRTERELRPSPGHGARLDPDDPASWHDVTRLYDGGRCAEGGTCPEGWRCVEVSTCRPDGENDSAIVAGGGHLGTRAQYAWAVARPFGTPAPELSVHAPDVSNTQQPSSETATQGETAEPAPTEPPAAGQAPSARSGCGCSASRPSKTWAWLVAAIAVVLRRRRSRSEPLDRGDVVHRRGTTDGLVGRPSLLPGATATLSEGSQGSRRPGTPADGATG